MSDARKLHRGAPAVSDRSPRRGFPVSPLSMAGFLQLPRISGELDRPPAPRPGATVVPLRPEVCNDEPPLAPLVDLPAFRPPTPRVAIVTIDDGHLDSTVALAVAVAGRAAAAAGLPGAIVTTARDGATPIARRKRGAVALRGFEPIGRAGNVTLLDAADAEAASIAAAGVVPVVCVLRAGEGLGPDLARICPSSLLLVAGAEAGENYVELLAHDLTRSGGGVTPRVLRYGPAVGEATESPSLTIDGSARLRLMLGLPPGRRSRANAELAVALLGSV
ncbi:MAG: hypothetical protein HZB14_05170 [Actinobacteria bacterium]|nr:hypothetical protein [Actinomycetota bacterium]